MQYLSCLVVLTSLFSEIIGRELKEKDGPVNRYLESFELIEEQIFKDANGAMEPQQTLNKLQALKLALVHLDKRTADREPYELYWLRKRVVDLIHHSVPKESKCQYSSLLGFKRKLDYPSNSISIDNYLQYYWRKQVLVCENYLDTNFREKLDEMKFDDVRQLDLLQMKVLKAITPHFDRYSNLDLSTLAPHILAYLEPNLVDRSEPSKSSRVDRAIFEEEFDRLIINNCANMKKTLDLPLDTYKLLKDYVHLFKNKPTVALDWLNTYEICDIIVENKKFYKYKLYDDYKKKHPKDHKSCKRIRQWLCKF